MPTPPHRPRARTAAALAWAGAVVHPALLFAVVGTDGQGVVGLPFGSRYLVPLVVLALPAVFVRRHPLAALLAGAAGLFVLSAVVDDRGGGITGWLWLLTIVLTDLVAGSVAARRRRAVSVPAVAATVLAQIGCVAGFPPSYGIVYTVIVIVLGGITVWVAGDSLRQRRRYAEARRAQAAHEAVQAERLRIARELHDMIAHSIGVIAIQAGVGGRVIESRPAAARDALATIEDTSRETLAGLRRLLGALRRTDPESGPTAPAPGLADLDALVARSHDAGVRVDVRWRGDRGPLPPDIDLSAYRVVQEALTNVVRHSGARTCAVTVERTGDALAVEIADDGHGAPAGAGAGYGIPGMRERVALLDGVFAAGPRPGGGFRVAARIPVPADAS